jgi:hypothetical protein
LKGHGGEKAVFRPQKALLAAESWFENESSIIHVPTPTLSKSACRIQAYIQAWHFLRMLSDASSLSSKDAIQLSSFVTKFRNKIGTGEAWPVAHLLSYLYEEK